eukprot:GGOE01057501.1.p2 GENE.GGOE01057501.1~~GGOE01057501.1.p2  ORF type:complete len:110 (-),score=28.16 GGOE01057501.1:105-395(-)
MAGYSDIELTCRDCSAPFTFSAGQQEFFANKGFDNQPSRCKDCQTARKQAGGGGYGGGSYGGGKGGGKGGSGCFKCGAQDHWSRECPQGGGGGSGW